MELKIIAKLWSAIYDLLLYIDGSRRKPLDRIREELGTVEKMCEPYAEEEDVGRR